MKKLEDKLEKCILCGNTLKPDLESTNWSITSAKVWDNHTYFMCGCKGKLRKDVRLSIG